jgi:hypothetical protein
MLSFYDPVSLDIPAAERGLMRTLLLLVIFGPAPGKLLGSSVLPRSNKVPAGQQLSLLFIVNIFITRFRSYHA